MSINGALFLIITNMTFANMFAVINVICMELPIFLREHFNGMYRADVYFITKQLAELPVFLMTPVIFVGIIYFMVGLNSQVERFFIAMGIAEVQTQAVVSFGREISSFILGLTEPFVCCRLHDLMRCPKCEHCPGHWANLPHSPDVVRRFVPAE